VSGVSVFSAGDFLGSDGSEAILLSDVKRGSYKKLVIAGGRLTGAVLIGDTSDALWYLEMIRAGKAIAGIRKDMMFGRALATHAKAA
jgi:nitrite reductase (NADH) large subunit